MMAQLMQMLGKMVVVIALMVAPFSMTYASMVTQAPETQHLHGTVQAGDTTLGHMALGHMTSDYKQIQPDDQSLARSGQVEPLESSHHHGNDNCCASFCSGALTVELDAVKPKPASQLKLASGVKSLEPGEWIPPFRPPSI